jgi:hypothetical protein
MGSAAPAWPHAALQRFQALEPAPFVPQRLGLDLLEAPKPPTARPRVVAAACALPAARLVVAEAERSQQIALRAPDQIVARARWARQPLFEREPARKASLACGSALHGLAPSLTTGVLPPLFVTTGLDPVVHAEWPRPMSVLRSSMDRRVKPGDDESFRCRDAPSHPSFDHAKKTPRKAKPKSVAKNSSLKKKGGGAPRGAPPGRIDKRCGARPFSCLPTAGGPRSRTCLGPQKMERARSPFGAPPRHPRLFRPRLGSGRASWNHRMQTGGPSPAPVQRAPRGPTRAGRDDAQAARERSVSLRPTRTAYACFRRYVLLPLLTAKVRNTRRLVMNYD